MQVAIKHNTLGEHLIQTLTIAVWIGLAVVSFGKQVPLFSSLGLNFYAVSSGSMEPAIPEGALIWIKPTKEINVGDIITYVGNDQQIITHRVLKIIQSPTKYITKGDANNGTDPNEVSGNQILGVYQQHLPLLGYLSLYVKTAQGFLSFVIAPAVVLVVWELISVTHYIKGEYERKLEAEVARIKADL